ncbi:hypothetical protein [Klebsiella pneumoniae]|uniref:hypothetical protein n=1 Tax=Klebsiella pneumoniae TaxID=573 RepID=UPI00115EBAFB|nr:hypothetical protein [Klebsiella pneumoniae]HBR3266113.1 hypothetical protein [Klebsiella pneumoniae]HCF8242583.1 hypothetical protein [Klebsiella pneumoniae]
MATAREPSVCRVAATPYPAYKWHWTHHYTGSVGPRKRSAAGHGPSQGAACMPDGGYALPGLQMALDPTIELDP